MAARKALKIMMENLDSFLEYVMNRDERLIAILINEINYRKKAGWRISDSEYFYHDLLNGERPTDRIMSDAKLQELQTSLYYLERLDADAVCYVIDKEKGLIPYENLWQAIDGSIGLERFEQEYLQPIFEGNEEWLEEPEEALEFLKAHLLDD